MAGLLDKEKERNRNERGRGRQGNQILMFLPTHASGKFNELGEDPSISIKKKVCGKWGDYTGYRPESNNPGIRQGRLRVDLHLCRLILKR